MCVCGRDEGSVLLASSIAVVNFIPMQRVTQAVSSNGLEQQFVRSLMNLELVSSEGDK